MAEFVALAQVVLVDLVLAGDNAIVVGIAVAGLPAEQRWRVMALGIGAATVLRIVFAAFTVQLLQIIGLMLAGGLLLLWVCWKLWRELRSGRLVDMTAPPGPHEVPIEGAEVADAPTPPAKTMRQAVIQIIVADVSMSLDNVLAVAGAAQGNTVILIIGLAIAIVLMAVAANYIATLLATYPWISWVGLAMIVYVALKMCWDGTYQLACLYVPADVCNQGLISTVMTLISGAP